MEARIFASSLKQLMQIISLKVVATSNPWFYEDGEAIIETSVLARPCLMTLYVIFPFHLNFPVRSVCALKAIIHRKKQWIVLRLLEKVFFSKRRFLWYCTCMCYLINFSILSPSVPIFHVSLSIIYLLFLPYHVLYTRFLLNICKEFSL